MYSMEVSISTVSIIVGDGGQVFRLPNRVVIVGLFLRRANGVRPYSGSGQVLLPQNRYALCGFTLCCRIEIAVRVFSRHRFDYFLFGSFISAPLCTIQQNKLGAYIYLVLKSHKGQLCQFLIPHLLQHLLQILSRIRPVASRNFLWRACADDSSAAVSALRA